MKILVLGANGMLGNAVIRTFNEQGAYETWGTVRGNPPAALTRLGLGKRLLAGIAVDNPDSLLNALLAARPDVVINCVGIVKQLAAANDFLQALPINTLFPHRLAHLCEIAGARVVHMSTDCVFSGGKGFYSEEDAPDAQDLYGRSKLLGEVDYPHAITLRTSIIGHELERGHGLIAWFLAQQGSVKGYTHAIFSGLPTCELARVIRDFVIPRPDLHGLYHVAAEPISKYELLQLVNQAYGKGLQIVPDGLLKIDRSLNGSRFREGTGYVAPSWPQLVAEMRAFG